ncbi:hypothetical protein FGO68_gene4827 [Halteria grandinella]|uniref:Calcineurin-like phosphoesterase domain-containing protein n=1 Tax=Halteria grandinella TaxID=5974 RepID=A0A8J8P150_HALGN|nr:hypothetical protein FGO68_gene4827 [Halteria grandinella]
MDAPQQLLDLVVEDLYRQYHGDQSVDSKGKIDVIIVTGDIVVHELSSKNFSVNNWEKQKQIITQAFETLTDRFPGVPILNAIGNNDAIHHYQAPNGTNKAIFYGDLFDLWFKNYTPNHGGSEKQLKQIETTFKKGGYYRFDLSNELTLLTLNSQFMSPKNVQDTATEADQLAWLEAQLSEKSLRKYIIQAHIPPGLMYVEAVQQFWKNSSQQQFTDLMNKYDSKVLLFIGAHIHTADVRAPLSFFSHSLNMSVIMTPSISPFHQNNPGYTILDLNVTKSTDEIFVTEKMTMRFFQLGEYLILKRENWITTDLETDFGFTLINTSSIQQMVENLKKDHGMYARYTVERLGFRQTLANFASISHTALQMFLARYKVENYLCAMSNYEIEGYNVCLEQQ